MGLVLYSIKEMGFREEEEEGRIELTFLERERGIRKKKEEQIVFFLFLLSLSTRWPARPRPSLSLFVFWGLEE